MRLLRSQGSVEADGKGGEALRTSNYLVFHGVTGTEVERQLLYSGLRLGRNEQQGKYFLPPSFGPGGSGREETEQRPTFAAAGCPHLPLGKSAKAASARTTCCLNSVTFLRASSESGSTWKRLAKAATSVSLGGFSSWCTFAIAAGRTSR